MESRPLLRGVDNDDDRQRKRANSSICESAYEAKFHGSIGYQSRCKRSKPFQLVLVFCALCLLLATSRSITYSIFSASDHKEPQQAIILDAFAAETFEDVDAFLVQLRSVTDAPCIVLTPSSSMVAADSIRMSHRARIVDASNDRRSMWAILLRELEKIDRGTRVMFLSTKVYVKSLPLIESSNSEIFISGIDGAESISVELNCFETAADDSAERLTSDVVIGYAHIMRQLVEGVLYELEILKACHSLSSASSASSSVSAALHMAVRRAALLKQIDVNVISLHNGSNKIVSSKCSLKDSHPLLLCQQAFDFQRVSLKKPVMQLPNSGSSRDLVLGMAMNINLSFLAPFVLSLRRYSSAKVVLFADDGMSEQHRTLLVENDINYIFFNPETDVPEHMRKWHPSSYRWWIMLQYLQKYESIEADRILTIDVRDSVFQSDPFKIIAPGEIGFWVFLEAPPRTIAECGWNSGWIRECFGQAVLSEVSSHIIACSGVSIGTRASVFRYLQQMSSTLEKNKACERNGVDQGVHNVLVWKNQISLAHIRHLPNGPVAHVQSMRAAVLENGILYNKKHEVYAIVHQYDRSPQMQQYYFQLYHYNANDRPHLHTS